MGEGKILIMGVGGCGSSFLWGLLGACGLETLGINEWMRYSGIRDHIVAGNPNGMEFPKVIKHLGGFICNLNEHIDRHDWEIEHIFFAVASLDLQLDSYLGRSGSKDRETYEARYRHGLGQGLIQLIERDHPFTIVRCPRSILDSEYCFEKLKVVLGGMAYEEFFKIHAKRIIPKKLKRLEKYKDD